MPAATKNTNIISIRLRHEEIDALKARAAATGDGAVTTLVRRLIRQELRRRPPK